MAAEWVTVRDQLPIPDNFEIANDAEAPAQQTIPSSDDPSTFSHALAIADHDEKGHAQETHNDEIKDLGWHEDEDKLANPLVGALPNEELWLLIRRFNKVTTQIKLAVKCTSLIFCSKCMM